MAFAFDMVGVGGLAMDLALRVDRLPLDDAKIPAKLVGQLPGGFIANATCAAAHLGLRTGYVGWVGDDNPGAVLRHDFERWGVDPAGLETVPGEITPFTIVITDRNGQRCILLPDHPLFHMGLTPAQRALAARARVVLSFAVDSAWNDDLYACVQHSGGVLALDIEETGQSPAEEMRRTIHRAHILFMSSSGLRLLGVESIAELAAPGHWVILTDGSRGSYGIAEPGTTPVFVPAYPVAQVADTTGAGDTFHAALIAAYLDGAALPDALAFASAAAALKVQHRGARGGLPTRAAVLDLMRGSP